MVDSLSPQTWPFSLGWLPQPAYLVGGGVRDALRGYNAALTDLDFVLPANAVETARAIANHYRAGFVLLDAERQIARVVFEQATADFALQVGPTLTTDLERRDFTVNAIAYEPHTQELFDPLHGCADLKQGVLRMVSPANLAEDPLRLLRAYRQAAQLGFELEPATQRQIRQLAPRLKQVAAERVRVELGYLLSTHGGTPMLQAAICDGLLQDWLPRVTATNLAQLAAVETAAIVLAEHWPPLQVDLNRIWGDRLRGGEATRRTLLAMAKLACLLGHDSQAAAQTLQNLKYSRQEILLVVNLLKLLSQIDTETKLTHLARRELFFLFQTAGQAFPALAVLSLAQGVGLAAIAPLITAWFNPDDAIAHPQTLITGKDLLKYLHLNPGPKIGQLLKQLESAQAEGKITTPTEALALAKLLLEPLF
ncbi:MAG: CCA tRNA nucleotidyltransferase [Aphanocapsa sp. GSE-SYN-MK-11-07L]|jgi:tRNA nucleotidyltransferase (CCA-adding enzyme)|nr:CCA tRNA nucleotidyltransferase [Aphanocapsa sp. GSE-SYN-MK-11-07L]